MENSNTTWRMRLTYMLVIVFMLLTNISFSQIKVVQFNAGWNNVNDVNWVNSLKYCKTISYIDVAANAKAQTKYKIAVVPTIIIFKDGEEVARFQADLSFRMVATKEEVQEEIDNILMSDF